MNCTSFGKQFLSYNCKKETLFPSHACNLLDIHTENPFISVIISFISFFFINTFYFFPKSRA
ncbi:hypothetical protein COM74_20170 [Bacillus thuringiensis]|nr:hypothetical protein COM74_20170 [Bacillus thuringiensis]